MKSIFALITRRMFLTLAVAGVVALPALAKEGNWTLDADHSTARVFLGTNTFNIGVARVDGNVELNAAEPTKSVLDLTIDPAGGKLITFKSHHATPTSEGRLAITGDMTLSRVVRPVMAIAAEDYYGPIYGEPITETVTREVMFVLPVPGSGGRTDQEITGEAKIFGENFPELFAAVAETTWQPVIQDNACEVPLGGEDYAGALCTGTAVDADHGEGYPEVPQGNLVTIVLNLHLNRENPEPAMASK